MRKLIILLFFSVLFPQNTAQYIDGVAAIVENHIILKSDLSQMINMAAIQKRIDPTSDPEKFVLLQNNILESMVDQKILLEMAALDSIVVAEKDVNAALDILAEFCTQSNEENNTGWDIHFHEEPSQNEVETISKQLINWNNLNDFNQRLFKMFRNSLKYGDQVFIRDPETFELFWVDMTKVTKIIVNESEGKEPEQYVCKDINPNFQNLTATQATHADDYHRQGDHKQTGYIQPSNCLLYTSPSPRDLSTARMPSSA